MKITPGHGPASTPDLTELPPARLRVLRALSGFHQEGDVKSADGEHTQGAGATAHQLAEHLDAHPNGVRRHLDALVADGLVTALAVRSTGRGRPGVHYHLTLLGRSALAGVDAPISAEYITMARAFAEYVATGSGNPVDDAHRIGRTWGQLLAGRTLHERHHSASKASEPGERRETATPADAATPAGGRESEAGESDGAHVRGRLIELLDGLGFSPQSRADGTVALRTCPLLDAATHTPDILCQVHLGMVQGAATTYGGTADGGELRAFAEPGACLLRFPGAAGRPPGE
ncbi:hypothetical protein KEM60_02950 [Austwickia sp. TVS 96-490-7B]|uniref:helix-turn-helix transcriptional regulator n=1 Tax=Austwickia sp. TVS 96-490-7B TaxID=2830843 RepID=UPI001C569E8D|nr:helix-turn-helix domain-containing protein [Austwickia sp. TVS 96-490-7B]MBW3086721.1 hypothetical protein [Austwickia sp. TVS 96-490-7B]